MTDANYYQASADGDVWEGAYVNDLNKGYAAVVYGDGFKFKGYYSNDKKNGLG